MKRKSVKFLAVLMGIFAAVAFSAALSSGAEMNKKSQAFVVSEGKSVKVEYTLTVDGKVVDSSKGHKPLEFKVGSHMVIPGFEKAVMGMKVGEKKSFKVSPDQGYGKVNPDAIREVPRKELPREIAPKVGMTLYAQGKDGRRFPVRIEKVKKDVVVMNFNHPLAGKTLNFDVEVVGIE
jgi:FKBP-type peptidyl-prolyl cis-trans isomerase 2